MGFKRDFNVNITRLSKAMAQKGFGTILVLSGEQEQVVKVYNNIADVEVDFTSTTETYRLANGLFGQGVDEILIAGKLTALASEFTALLNATTIANDSFFGVVCTDNEADVVTAIAEWVNTQEKVYAVTSQNKTIANTSNQTMIAYHPTDYLAEKSLAYMLTKEIGSVDLDGKAVPNISSSLINATEYATFKENNINVCIEKFGNLVVDGGDMAGGEKIDIILSEFWIKIRMEEDLAMLKVNTPKIPYANAGVALLIDVASTRLKLATQQGIISLDDDGIPEYEITYLPVADVPMADRANRKYDYVKWTARLAGSIRTGVIQGTLTI